MRVKHLIGLGAVASLVLLVGCDTTTDKTSLLESENVELRDQLGVQDRALEAAHADLKEANRTIRELEDRLATAPATVSVNTTNGTAFDGIDGISTSVSGRDVTVTVSSDVLFDSGRTSLKSGARKSLDQVAGVLKSSYPGKTIRVIGHTDSDPIRKSGHKSNYHLGFERGYAVREYLISCGVSPSNVSIMSYGPDMARDTKSRSRRVEIVVAE